MRQLISVFLKFSLIISILLVLLWSKEVKIGAILAVSGPASFLGDPELKTLEYLVKKQNKAGGIKGRKIKLVAYDSEGNAKKALTFAKRLISQDKVSLIIGPSTTGETLAIVKTIEQASIPLISLAGASLVTRPVKKYVFATPPTDRMVCDKLLKYFRKNNYNQIAIISGTGGFGKAMRAQCNDLAKNYNIEVLIDLTYNPKDSDMTVQLNKIKNEPRVKAIINAGFGQSPTTVTKNYSQLGIKKPLFQSHGVASNKFIEITGSAGEGVFVVGPPLLVVDLLQKDFPLQKISLRYKKEFGKAYKNVPVSSFGAYAFDAFGLAIQAMKKSKNFQPQIINKELEKIKNFISPSGIYNMSSRDHSGLDAETSFLILRIQKGQWTIIE